MSADHAPATVTGEVDDDLDARTVAAAAMRRLGHAMVAHTTDVALLRRIAREADATAALIEAQPARVRDIRHVKQHLWEEPPPPGEPMAHFVECVVSGQANPMGMALRVRREGERAVAEVNLGPAFEGAPRRAHGGVVAAILDDVMGYVLLVQSTPAYTGRMTVTYRAACPVQTPLVASAWLVGREGRKLSIRGELRSDEELIAESEGLFIEVSPERFRAS